MACAPLTLSSRLSNNESRRSTSTMTASATSTCIFSGESNGTDTTAMLQAETTTTVELLPRRRTGFEEQGHWEVEKDERSSL